MVSFGKATAKYSVSLPDRNVALKSWKKAKSSSRFKQKKAIP